MEQLIVFLTSVNWSTVPWGNIGTGIATFIIGLLAEISRRNATKAKEATTTIDRTVIDLTKLVLDLNNKVTELEKIVEFQSSKLQKNATLISELNKQLEIANTTIKQLIELLKAHNVPTPIYIVPPVSVAKET